MPHAARAAVAVTLVIACSLASAPAVADAHLEGLVQAVDGRAAPGYTLHLIDADGREVGRTTSTADGRYAFSDLEPGSYALGIEDPAGRMGAVDAPPLRLGPRTLARRDVRIVESAEAIHDATLRADASVGMWWAGLTPAAKAWSIVGVVFFGVVLFSAVSGDDDEPDGSPSTTP